MQTAARSGKPVADNPPKAAPDYLGPILVVLLALAMAFGIAFAVRFDNERVQPTPITCDGLYASVQEEECCQPEPHRDGDGLFDAEEEFAQPDC